MAAGASSTMTVRCVVDGGELDAVGVPLGIGADATLQ